MVVLSKLPTPAIVSGFKGKIDYYVCRGTPCARKWPSTPRLPRAPAVQAQYAAWATASRLWATLSPAIQADWNKMASGSGLCGRDVFQKTYLAGVYNNPH